MKTAGSGGQYPSDIEIGTWFQLSTCAHHIDPDGEHIGKRARFLTEKAVDWARAKAGDAAEHAREAVSVPLDDLAELLDGSTTLRGSEAAVRFYAAKKRLQAIVRDAGGQATT